MDTGRRLNLDSGIITLESGHSVEQTIQRLKDVLEAKRIQLFALIDHSGEAEKVGLHMLPAKLLVFGIPEAGTPLMIAAPSAALDLPLKILVSEDSAGKVWLSFNSPDFLRARHGFPARFIPVIAAVESLAQMAAAVTDLPAR